MLLSMSNLIKEEADADDAFWGQEFFKDETNDNEFISEEGILTHLAFAYRIFSGRRCI